MHVNMVIINDNFYEIILRRHFLKDGNYKFTGIKEEISGL